jgi:hypothetical protein
MEFTKISLDNPVVVPAVEEKVYDKLWLSHIRINSSPTKATVVANLVPYNGESILAEPLEQIVIDNIFAEMVNEDKPAELRMLYAQVMELLLQTVKAEKEYQKNVQENITEEDTTDEEPTPEL